MHPKQSVDCGEQDLFRSRLDQIINTRHPIVKLAQLIDWKRLEKECAVYYTDWGRPGLPIRLIMGLHLLKYIYGLSDEEVCGRWEENPYYQYFCGETFFQHRFPIERSSMSHFRNRIPPDVLDKVLQESLSAAHQAGALALKDLRSVAVDTTVQEKAISHPSEHGLILTAVTQLGRLARKVGIKVRQSYERVLKKAAIKVGRYIHAKQMKRARRQLKFMRTRLGRLLRDVERKAKNILPHNVPQFKETVQKARQIYKQKRGDAGYLYAWHAPEVECISKGKARKPYEFGNKVSLATHLHASKGRHFILQAQALHGNPYDGHTLASALSNLKDVVGREPRAVYVDKGYKGHKIKKGPCIIISGQKRGLTDRIKREMKRRSVIEPIIGHAKNDGLLGRNWLKGHKGDQLNALFSAIGFNLRQLLGFLRDNPTLLPA